MALFELEQDYENAEQEKKRTFKDFAAADIDAVFFNGDEHAEPHNVDGKDVLVILEKRDVRDHSAATSTDNAVKKALKQIHDNPGGIILDYGEHEITAKIFSVIQRRVERSNLPDVDVMFLQNGKLIRILKYKNEGR